MDSADFQKVFVIDPDSSTPKYVQLSNAVVKAVEHRILKKDDYLPSLAELSALTELGRDTVEKAYKRMKRLGVVGSVPGKGYYVLSSDFKTEIRICLLFNKLSAHKKIIYDAFTEVLGDGASIDFYIYNNNLAVLRKLIDNKMKEYSHYVIIPHFLEDEEERAPALINGIPREQLLLLDKILPGIEGSYAAVYEDFEWDIYHALSEVKGHLQKYHTIKVIFPEDSYYPKEIQKGIRLFCGQFAFDYEQVSADGQLVLEQGALYVCVTEEGLVGLLEQILESDLVLGQDIGVISYNETPIKKILLDGITTVSTDFRKMGVMAAQMILEKRVEHQKVPFLITLRPSV